MSSPTPINNRSVPEQILNRIEWHILRRLDGLLQGDYRTLFYGAGLDFSDLREYQPHDDIRHIDWNVTARMDTPYVRQYVEDREITAWFIVDLTTSMTFGPQDSSKQQQLTDLVGTLALLLTRQGNRVGALIFRGDHMPVTQIPPKTGRNQLLRLIQALLSAENNSQPPGSTRLAPFLEQAATAIKRRSMVTVVSDFISDPGWERPLSQLKRRHECLAIRFWDPLEFELPAVGLIPIEDIETGEQLWVDTSDPVFREKLAAVGQRRLAELNESMRLAGVDAFSVSTQENATDALVRLAQRRKKRRQTVRR